MAIAFLGVALFGVGYFLVTLISPRLCHRDRLIISFPVGTGFYTLVLFCLNQGLGLSLSRPLLMGLLVGALVLLWWASFSRRGCRGNREAPQEPAIISPLTPLAKFELILLFLLFSLIIVVGTVVPVWNWDAYAEYFPLAREIFREQSIPIEASPTGNGALRAYPLGYTLLISCGYILHGDILHMWARFLNPLYALLLVLLLYRIGQRFLGFSREIVLGGLLLCTSLPLFYEYSIVPSSKICFCFYAVAALYFLMEYWERREKGPLILAGIFLGLSYWTCYTGAVFVPCVFLLLIILAVVGLFLRSDAVRGLRLTFREFLVIFLITLAICTPHLLRNYLVLGNPVYPALYQWFGGLWINEWSIEHVLHGVVPGGAFYLRPRWEIFHEGFLIQCLFFLSLFSWPWYRRKNSLFIGLFCLLYLGFYLKFLTWPRSSGISLKLLLPMLIPASLMAGERFNRILRRELPLWQGIVILAAIPVWWMVMMKDEIIYMDVGRQWLIRSFPSAIYLVRILFVDFDEALIWIGVVLCLFIKARIRKKSWGRLLPTFLLLAVVSRCFGEGVYQLTRHIRTYNKGPSYSFWNAAAFPGYLPEAQWLEGNLPRDAVIGSFDTRVYLYPRRVFPLDAPALWPMYQGMDMEECIALLRRNGITHFCLSDFTANSHLLYGKSPIFKELGNPDYLPLIFTGPTGQETGHELKVYEIKNR